ncbi:MAG: 7-carboxy-7-deazaguanine synthase QueE [Planctomycetota bacterium]
MASRAPLVGIFASVQGEGRHVGVPMTFLRVATCPLRCGYCDTKESHAAPPLARIALAREAVLEPNPVRAPRAAELALAVGRASPLSPAVEALSITGGEPLVFPEFVREVSAAVRSEGMRVHLETAAADPGALERCIGGIDHLSADYKLPSALKDRADLGEQNARCVGLAASRGISVDVKIVLMPGLPASEFEQALERLRPWRRHLLLVVQPWTPQPSGTERGELRVPFGEAEHLAGLAARAGFEVRILPQVHPLLGAP